ncbi:MULTISPECIES: indolepyruvate ferredoxin oxidoreductase subunit alpha [unclassified Prochlorococcus]|uniref:indolepyruvate ferredoxin oxidoreductase subunit alpha n=1 Tax=unclassified Prochlorococcus TaxID=2627481 RepID=UPI000533B142|nr:MULTISPECIES: 4Fe-4S dicluster domain-containing protein [unclassified Prochlorococcus]KGG17532.1 Ferredoxin [Prochlorococcus sp. MIT 0603]
MPHSIKSDLCEGIALCVEACPVDCIKQRDGKNQKGTNFYFIEFSKCIDCGVCLAVCPIQGAVIPEERANEQKTYK